MGFAVAVGGDFAMIHLGKEAFRVQFEGADPDALFAGDKKSATPNIYFGADKPRSVETYLQLRREGIYPGIDLVYYGAGQNLEYDFLLAPGADASRIRMHFDGAQSSRLAEDGSLVLSFRNGEITQKAPVTYQHNASGEVVSVPSRYVAEEDGVYSLKLDEYDDSQPLVIDPAPRFARRGRRFHAARA